MPRRRPPSASSVNLTPSGTSTGPRGPSESQEGPRSSQAGHLAPSQASPRPSQASPPYAQGSLQPSQGSVQPSQRSPLPSKGSVQPSQGSLRPSQGSPQPSQTSATAAQTSTPASQTSTPASQASTPAAAPDAEAPWSTATPTAPPRPAVNDPFLPGSYQSARLPRASSQTPAQAPDAPIASVHSESTAPRTRTGGRAASGQHPAGGRARPSSKSQGRTGGRPPRDRDPLPTGPSRLLGASHTTPAQPAKIVADPPQASARGRGLRAFLESRTGYRTFLHAALSEPVIGGPSWAYIWGSLLLFVLVNQTVTGVLLASHYGPTQAAAWASVAYIQDQVALGWFIRGLHSAGASSLYVVLLLHLLQVTLYGAYRAPREVNWVTGVLLCGLVAAFGLTGYLLPWDQRGYAATQVATTLLGSVPVLGPPLQRLLQGGPDYGNLTLTRFYALHVLVLPLLTLLLTLVHVALFRRHGVTPRWDRSRAELLKRTEPFWPRQALYDLCGGGALLLLMAGWTLWRSGAELGAPADPAAPYQARPEWFFLPLYQILKYVPGPLEGLVALLLPLGGAAALLAIPFLKQRRTGAASARPQRLPLGIVAGGVLGALALGSLARISDARDPAFQAGQALAREQSERARRLALQGVPAEGGTAVYRNDPLELGRQVYAAECLRCHPLRSRELALTLGAAPLPPEAGGRQEGPDLSQFGARSWIEGFLRDPNGRAYFGTTRIHGMKPIQGSDDELRALTEYIYSLAEEGPVSGARADGELAARGKALFAQRNCDVCHERDGKTEGEGPNLKGFAGVAWIRDLLERPAAAVHFGEQNQMPSYAGKLSAEELARVSAFVAAQRGAAAR